MADMERILPEDIVATDVSFEDYLDLHAEHRREWVEGVVVKAMAIEEQHFVLTSYFLMLFQAYFGLNPIAVVRGEPYVMRLPTRGREPDLMVIMNDNPHPRRRLFMDGPADIVIEVISPGSERTDLGDKFVEYEKGGVREYWIIDHLRGRAFFYRRNEEGFFILHMEDAEGHYSTPLLPKFKLHVPTLWHDELPDLYATVEFVKRHWEGE